MHWLLKTWFQAIILHCIIKFTFSHFVQCIYPYTYNIVEISEFWYDYWKKGMSYNFINQQPAGQYRGMSSTLLFLFTYVFFSASLIVMRCSHWDDNANKKKKRKAAKLQYLWLICSLFHWIPGNVWWQATFKLLLFCIKGNLMLYVFWFFMQGLKKRIKNMKIGLMSSQNWWVY